MSHRPERPQHAGYLRLASLVQYVPLPVVGGYLGYVGYFCLASGVSLASGIGCHVHAACRSAYRYT